MVTNCWDETNKTVVIIIIIIIYNESYSIEYWYNIRERWTYMLNNNIAFNKNGICL